MAWLLFVISAVIFFLIGADIAEVDVVWGFFFLALGHCVGGLPAFEWPYRRP